MLREVNIYKKIKEALKSKEFQSYTSPSKTIYYKICRIKISIKYRELFPI